MRIGELQEQILKVMYENKKSYISPKDIVVKITGLKYAKEKDYGITWETKQERIFNAPLNYKKMKNDNFTKTYAKIEKLRNKFHKESTSVYRAIKLLEKNKLIKKVRYGLRSWGCSDYYELTEKGRRVISHRL